MSMFMTFSWGEYPFNQKFKTIKSVLDTGNKMVWKDVEEDGMSCARGRNLACYEVAKLVDLDDVFVLIDRDMFIEEYTKVDKLPFGVVGVYGRDVNIDSSGRRLSGARTDNYVIPMGHIDLSKPVSSALAMSRRTFEFIGKWDERLGYSRDFWGMEDSEWLFRGRMKGCEFVRLDGISFGHFDHWIDEEKEVERLENLLRRHLNSVKLFEMKYGVRWDDFSEAQENSRRFIDERRKDIHA